MAKVICPNCGSENNVTKKSGQECEYCGTTLPSQSINENKKDSKDNKGINENYYFQISSEFTPEFINEKAKEFIFERLCSMENDPKYGSIIQPVNERIKLFSFQTEIINVPVYIYFVKGKKLGGEISHYLYMIDAGGPFKEIPIVTSYYLRAWVSYKEIDMELHKLPIERKDSNPQYVNKNFPDDPKDLWDSVRGRDLRKELIDWEIQHVFNTFIPFFIVKVNIGENTKAMIYDWRGKRHHSIFESDLKALVGEAVLGKNYEQILENQWNEKQLQIKQEQEELERQRLLEQKKKDRKTNIGCVFASLFTIVAIVGTIYGLFFYLPDKREKEMTQIQQETEERELKEFVALKPEKAFVKEFKGKWLTGNDNKSPDEKWIRIKIKNNHTLQYQTYQVDGLFMGKWNWGKTMTADYSFDYSLTSDITPTHNGPFLIIKFSDYEGVCPVYNQNGELSFDKIYLTDGPLTVYDLDANTWDLL